MIVVCVLYAHDPSARFDLDYYRERHLPLVRELLEPMGMRSLTYYQPVATGAEPAFQLIAELRFDTMADTEAALTAHGPTTQADIANFTELKPLVLIGEEIQA
jgi:uncharacterized protein (TIGR02118 family)